MLNAYKGELYEVPIAGDVAMAILTATKRSEKSEMGGEQKAAGPMAKEDSTRTRNWRVFNYSAVIFRNVVLFTFLSFFYNYMAWYHTEANGSVTRLPMLTGEYSSWLPILITALILSTAANILFIIYEKYDKYWLSETIQIILNMIGIAVVIALVSVFPFDFSVIPNSTAVDIVPILARFVLILTAAGLGLRVLLRFIKLISTATRQ
jgi:uncharacterized membrane protein